MALLPLTAAASPTSFQIVATITPKNLALCPELVKAGATSFRLNASHLAPESLRAAADGIRALVPDAPLVIDLQGAKMRFGDFTERALSLGDRLKLSSGDSTGSEVLPVPHPELFASARPGDTLRCDDDRLRLRVESVAASTLDATVLVGGLLRPRKGLNVLEHPVDLVGLTAADQARIEALAGVRQLSWAFSFMKDGAEASWLRARLGDAPIIGKIERAEAVDALDQIDARVDATWVCRGDLGAQLGLSELAEFVSGFAPHALRHPTLMAGQVLEHLTEHAEPTRSEVCHLFDLLLRGYAGIVLSDETAIGRDPVRAVRTAASLVEEFRGQLERG